jgi:hypothetical protein
MPRALKAIVYLGMVTHNHLTSEEGEAFVIYLQNKQTSQTCGPRRVGDTAHLSWKPEHTLIVENSEANRDRVATKESV